MNRIRSISIASLKHEVPNEQVEIIRPSSSWILTEFLQNFPARDSDSRVILENSNKLIDLLSNHPDIKRDLNLINVLNKVSHLVISSQTELRALYYKILRYCIINEDSLYILIQNKLLIFLIISLSTTNSYIEKYEAIKLINKFLVTKNGSNYLSIGVIKALIYLLEDPSPNDSDLKYVIIESLLEISILNPQLIYHSNGFNLLINLLIENTDLSLHTPIIQLNCLLIIIKLLEINNFKIFFRNGFNLLNLILIFEQDIEDKSLPVLKFQRISFLLTVFLKNWNGLICSSLNDFKMLKDFINNLCKPYIKLKEFILDILLDVLLIRSLPWLRNSLIGEFFGKFGNNQFSYNIGTNEDPIMLHYINHYQGLLTVVLIKLGLIDLLVANLNDTANKPLHDKIILLLSNVYKFSKTYLPIEYDLDLSKEINMKSLMKISEYNLSTDKSPQINIQYQPTNCDDNEFKHLINASKVMQAKEFTEWDWKILVKLFQGPLQYEKKFNDLLEKQPKFFKRLLSFYRPFKLRFCNLPIKNDANYKKIIAVGNLMFEIFSKNPEGLKILLKNKILLQMVEILAQIDPFSGIYATNPILSVSKLINTVNFGYLTFIGKLTQSSNGIKLLEHWQFFQVLNGIIDSSQYDTNNYFIILLFKAVSFELPKVLSLLSKVMLIGNTALKLEIIKLIPGFELNSHWLVKLVITNIYQLDIKDELLELVDYENASNLEILLKSNPSIIILSKSVRGKKILTHLLKLSSGFTYLCEYDYINSQFTRWLNDYQHFNIIKFYESKINNLMFPYFKNEVIEYDFFLRNLLDTKEGLSYFEKHNEQTGFIQNLMNNVKKGIISLNTLEGIELLKLKQDIWVLGEINSSNYGMLSLEVEFLSTIITQFQQCPNWSYKGLLFYQIGKISLNNEGIEILDELNWLSRYDKFNRFNNFSYPRDLGNLNIFNINYNEINEVNLKSLPISISTNDDSIEDNLLLELIYRFSSFFSKIEKKLGNDLKYLKTNQPELFNMDNFMKVIKIIDNSSYNFSKRNFIFNLFIDNRLNLENLIKKRR